MTVHKSQVKMRDYKNVRLSKLIDICATNEQPNFRIFHLYKFKDNASCNQRIRNEAYLITKYKPILNASTLDGTTTTI